MFEWKILERHGVYNYADCLWHLMSQTGEFRGHLIAMLVTILVIFDHLHRREEAYTTIDDFEDPESMGPQ